MLPEGWKRIPIKDACESIIDCVNKTAPVVDYETPYKMIRTTNVRHGRVDVTDVRYVAKETYLEWTRRGLPKKGDIIFTREAPVGEVGVLEDDTGVFLGQRTMMYRADNNKANNYYLFYSLLTKFCQKQIEDFSNGGTVAHMRVPDCGEILVNLPPLPEQKKIAQILSTWDKAITTTEQLIANSQQQKKALMKQLLTGKKRLLDDNGVRFSGEWEHSTLRNILTVSKGQQLNKDTLDSTGLYPVINGGITPSGYTDQKNRSANTITISEGGNSCGYVAFQTKDFWCGGHCYSATNLKLNLQFTYHCLKFNENRIMKLRVGSGLPNIQKKDIDGLVIKYPNCHIEQQKIASVLSSADREIEVLQSKLTALKQEKISLMQQLLTGKRRVIV